jgi:hypothetical protein
MAVVQSVDRRLTQGIVWPTARVPQRAVTVVWVWMKTANIAGHPMSMERMQANNSEAALT